MFVDERFDVQRTAGAGGMGTVYRALDLLTGEFVALKVLDDAAAPESLERFEHEARLLEGLAHPAVVRYAAHGRTPEGKPWLAMEWLEGEDLSTYVGHHGISIAESVVLARRVADALGAVHARGIVHRDVKPANLFLPGGRVDDVKVIDFGLARPRQRTHALTRTGTFLGTPGYMAPEQVRGGTIDPRADVFSLGAVLFECITGKLAFAGDHVMAVLAKLLFEEVPRADELRDGVPPALADLVASMLAKEPAERPRDGRAVADALATLADLSHATTSQRVVPPPSLTGSEERLLCAIIALPPSPVASADSNRTLAIGWPQEAVTALRAAVLPLGGRVDELAGAMLVTLAGAENLTDQAARAAHCALAIRAAVPDVALALVAGRGDTAGRLPIGTVVERAARILSSARERPSIAGIDHDPVLIDDVMRALLGLRFDVRESPIGAVLLGEHDIGEEARPLLGRPSPCVGRERELRNIEASIEESITEEVCRAVIVTAPAGAGKSRLRQELTRSLRKQRPELAIWIGRGDMVRTGSAFSLLGSALRHAAGITGSEPPEARRDKLRALASIAPPPDAERIAAFLGEITGAPFPLEEAPFVQAARHEAAVMAEQIQRAFEQLMRARGEAGPLVLILEDMHWGDAPSVRLVDRALGALADRPFTVVALARPEVHDAFPQLWKGRAVDEMRLAGLGRRAAEKLVRNALGDAADSALVTRIVDRADGNAFYLEELVRAVAEGRGDALPETVLGMVETRIGSLEPDARRILRAASIFGEVFWADGVAALLGGRPGTAPSLSWLDRLIEREVLVAHGTSRFAGERQLAFRHALLCEGAYATLTDADRVLGHRLAGEWLARAGEGDPMVLATHFDRGGDALRAAPWYLRAAESALWADDARTAISRAERGIARSTDDDLSADLLMLRGEALALAGDFVESTRCLEEVLRLARPGTRAHTSALAGWVANSLVLGKEVPIAETFPILLGTDPAPDARDAFAWALSMVTDILLLGGAIHLVPQGRAKLEAIAREGGAGSVAACWLDRVDAAWARSVDGDRHAALRIGLRAITFLERAGELHHTPFLRALATLDFIQLGAPERGEELLAASKAETWPLTSFGGLLVAQCRARLLMRSGRYDEACALLTTVIDDGGPTVPRVMRAQCRLLRAFIELERGDLDGAERDALASLENMPVPAYRLDALTALAGIRLRAGRAAEAVAFAEEAFALARQSGITHEMRSLLLVTHARALAATGDTDRAREAIAAARDELLGLAAKIDDPELRTSFLENVPANAEALSLAAQWLGGS
ncbi:serine/threonine-protein kinase PknK [Polyangium aurulentum]|uniref:serine/threonine-protein kinase n=1 Tax=Polyangium aurulentum TaxID=2567896 RepID=UPI001F19ABE7|nr:serine/threonine-protein kinase [Polyangium aurulentum]UQA63042.1 protein kinase [Polyangium aurulentum]